MPSRRAYNYFLCTFLLYTSICQTRIVATFYPRTPEYLMFVFCTLYDDHEYKMTNRTNQRRFSRIRAYGFRCASASLSNEVTGGSVSTVAGLYAPTPCLIRCSPVFKTKEVTKGLFLSSPGNWCLLNTIGLR